MSGQFDLLNFNIVKGGDTKLITYYKNLKQTYH